MKNTVETYNTYELSNEDLKAINGGYNIIEYIAMGIGWYCGTFNKYYEAGAAGAEYGPKF